MATAVPVLERTQEESSLKAYGKLQGGVAPQEMTEEQKALAFNARISENYQKLINPDYHKAEDVTDADLMPTETTNQYRDSLYREERPAEHAQEKKKGFALTARNKLLIAVYSIVVVVVLALIIVNTSVLGSLDAEVTAREAALNAAIETSQNLEAEIDYYTDADTIISRAEDELGMYMPD